MLETLIDSIVTPKPTKQGLKLLGITLNNMGAIYKRQNNLEMALKYLCTAIKYEINANEATQSIATTHINICAILS
jgi:hypothetical protein